MKEELIRVTVLYFGEAADIAQKREDEISLFAGTSAAAAFENILHGLPALRDRFRRSLLFAVNLEYVTGEKLLRDGDELAIFPPVSGG